MKITEEQRLAINAHDVSVAVSAAAGSGKTSVLTKRIIKHVCDDGGKISRILAVTFTEAAAAEILERVSRAISEKLAEDPSNKHIARQSLLVNSAKISTVHTFCYGIVRENFEDIGLPSDISVADAAWLDSQKKKIMLSLADDYLDGKIDGAYKIDDFTLLADTFSEKSNMDDFCKTALNIYEKLSSRAEFIDSLDEYIQMYKNAASGNFKDSFFGKALREIMLSSAQTYARIFDDAVKYAEENDEYAAAVPRFKQSADFAKQLCDFVQNGFDYESAAELLESYKPDDLRGVKPENQSDKYIFFKEKRGDFNKFVNAFKSEFFCFDANDIDYAADYSAKVLEDLKKFLSVFDKRFKAEKIRRHVISFSDMEHYALDILWDRENDAPTKAALSVRESYDEVFIDEYQDTNEVQDKIFSLICKDNNKFCVGDVKQSIYGFRGAAPYIFTKMLDSRPKYEEGITEPSKIFLSKNFRSNDCILNFCNTVFDTLMNVGKKGYGADERLVRGLENDSDEKASDGEKSEDANKVEIGIFDKNGESENEYIAKRITELVRSGYKYSDIAILVRKNKHVEPIANELAKYNIPYVNPDEKEFFKSPEVLLVLSLLSVIDNPAKDVYLAATLKSRIYGVTLDELLRIRAHSDGSLFDAL
ncbi:MAG: UvrD-helicase domain-containing protein, partial [Clostridiales bacterium]|nr:UvrD-helicase domain-containing protein [Clostridiales bacterium]